MLNNYKIFKPLVSQILDLQNNGITINVNGSMKTVYMELFNMSVDNLEFHGLIGMQESFNSTYPCSRCIMPKNKCKTEISVDETLLRNTKDHPIHVKDKSHGVKDGTIFMNIPDFNCFKHMAFDYAHDFLEGSLRHEMAYTI